MSTFVGVDVGASHTEAAFACGTASPSSRIRRPGIAVRCGQTATAAEKISTIIFSMARDSAVLRPLTSIVVGAAGTHTSDLRSGLENALRDTFPETLLQVTTDGAIALEGAFGDRPGIVVCAGSGSIAYARDPGSSLRRAGGLGPILADEGSGYAIGLAGLRAAARAADGRSPNTILADSLMAAVNVATLDELIDWAWDADRPAIAALASIVGDEASSGDEVSRTILAAAAADLGRLVLSLARWFERDCEIDVAFSGGVLKQDSAVRAALRSFLEQSGTRLRIADVQVDPVLGAVAMAKRLASQ